MTTGKNMKNLYRIQINFHEEKINNTKSKRKFEKKMGQKIHKILKCFNGWFLQVK